MNNYLQGLTLFEVLDMNPRWFSALSCNILFLKEDDVQNDTERDEEEGKTQNFKFL